ncbi:hypothetical protein GSI_13922 [Ganoderma sinense ZZ0214-1]|uniref:ATPase inhibitor, mitochondrial n=1 Tax=Ganoderma sinense ZZ0214-1 TaxID=1077348 RepID=A0A2G8RRN5_9APHY|nr:hypothetical protein GSI_13922 [Ganoderma sinense ZZ0214-1]
MSSGQTAQNGAWKQREQAAENQYVHAKEAEQLKAIRDELANKRSEPAASEPAKSELDRDFEGGYGGQEDLEDRYATTCGEH